MRVKGNKLFEPAPRERPCSISWVKGGRVSERAGGGGGAGNLHLTRTKFSALSQFAVGLDSDQGHRFHFGFQGILRTKAGNTTSWPLSFRSINIFIRAITPLIAISPPVVPFWCCLTRRARENGTFVRHRPVDRHDRRSKCFLSLEGFLPNRGGVEERFEYSSVAENHPLVGGDSYRGTSVVKHVPIVK